MNALRVGLGPWTALGGSSPEGMAGFLRQAELAEELDYHSIWLPESHFDPAGSCPSPLLLLAGVAARTSRIRLGTTSYLLPVRHPVHVAEEVAVLDHLSGGRVIFGVGRGFRSTLFTTFGVPASEKRDRFELALETVRRAWSGEPIAPEGDAEATPVRVNPRPVQKPHPPIWVAAFGPKALTQVGRLGLPYLASPVETLERLVENYARHREALPDEARDPPLEVPVIRTVFVSRDPSRARDVRDALESQARGIAKRLGGRFAGLAEERVDSWALVGEPGEVADRLSLYRERIGLSLLIARAQVPEISPEESETSIRLLAEEVMPRVTGQ